MTKKDLMGNIDGLTIMLMSLDILQKEVGDVVAKRKEAYKDVKTDFDPDDFGSFMKHMTLIADIKGTEMAMDAISLSIATFAFSVQYNVNLNRLAEIIKDLGDGHKYQANEVMESVANKTGKPFEELTALMMKEFNLTEETLSPSVVKGVSEWVMKFLLDVQEFSDNGVDFESSNRDNHHYDA